MAYIVNSSKAKSFEVKNSLKFLISLISLILLSSLQLVWPIPTLLGALILLLIIIIVIRPYFALFLAIFFMSFEVISILFISENTIISFKLFFVFVVLGLLSWLYSLFAGTAKSYQTTSVDLPLLIFWITGIISLLWSAYIYIGLGVVLSHMVGYFLLLFIGALNTNKKQIERLFWLIFGSGLLIVITTIFTFCFKLVFDMNITNYIHVVANIEQFNGNRLSLTGFMGGPKPIALMLDNTIMIGLGLMCTRTSRSSGVWIYLGILAMLFIHLLTLSRVDAVGLFCGWWIFVYLHPHWRPKMLRHHFFMAVSTLIVVVSLYSMLAVYFKVGELFARIAGAEQTMAGYKFSSLQGRLDFTNHCLQELWATGGFGRGSGGIMPSFEPTRIMMAPNLYFSVLVDHGLGILSFILFCWMAANLIMELRRARRDCLDTRYLIFINSIIASLVVYAVAGLLDHAYSIYDVWLVLGVSLAVIKVARHT